MCEVTEEDLADEFSTFDVNLSSPDVIDKCKFQSHFFTDSAQIDLVPMGPFQCKVFCVGESQLVPESWRISTQKSARTHKLYLPPDCEKMW